MNTRIFEIATYSSSPAKTIECSHVPNASAKTFSTVNLWSDKNTSPRRICPRKVTVCVNAFPTFDVVWCEIPFIVSRGCIVRSAAASLPPSLHTTIRIILLSYSSISFFYTKGERIVKSISLKILAREPKISDSDIPSRHSINPNPSSSFCKWITRGRDSLLINPFFWNFSFEIFHEN